MGAFGTSEVPADPSLGGWDTISSLSVAEANRSLAASASKLPMTFALQVEGASIAGTFGGWEIVPGGSGEYLYLSLPIESGSMSFEGTVDLGGLATVMELSLRLIPSDDGSQEQLCFALMKAAAPGTPPSPGLVTGVEVVDQNHRLDKAQQAVLLGLMAEFLVGKASEIAFVFASINLVPPSGEGWLTPVRSAYAYTEASESRGPSGYLSILSVVESRAVDSLPRTVPSQLLTESPREAFGIGLHLLLGQIVQSLPAALDSDASAGNFAIGANDVITSVAPFDLGSVKSGAITYHPTADSLTTCVVGSNLSTTIEGHCDMYAGIEMTFSVNCSNAFAFNSAAQTFSFSPDPNPEVGHSADIPWYLKWLVLIVGAITEAVVALIANSLANSLSQRIGQRLPEAIGQMSVDWADQGPFHPTSGELNGALILKSPQ